MNFPVMQQYYQQNCVILLNNVFLIFSYTEQKNFHSVNGKSIDCWKNTAASKIFNNDEKYSKLIYPNL